MAQKEKSTRLVIDASVACASGSEGATHHTAKNCRDFLKAVLEISHRLVMTPDIREEWHKHQSAFARKWQVRMFARSKVDYIEPTAQVSLSRKVKRTASDNGWKKMDKDFHLIKAAIEADRTVIARDDQVRKLFVKASDKAPELRSIVWVNPDCPEEDPIGWLERGAKPEEKHKLGKRR